MVADAWPFEDGNRGLFDSHLFVVSVGPASEAFFEDNGSLHPCVWLGGLIFREQDSSFLTEEEPLSWLKRLLAWFFLCSLHVALSKRFSLLLETSQEPDTFFVSRHITLTDALLPGHGDMNWRWSSLLLEKHLGKLQLPLLVTEIQFCISHIISLFLSEILRKVN